MRFASSEGVAKTFTCPLIAPRMGPSGGTHSLGSLAMTMAEAAAAMGAATPEASALALPAALPSVGFFLHAVATSRGAHARTRTRKELRDRTARLWPKGRLGERGSAHPGSA